MVGDWCWSWLLLFVVIVVVGCSGGGGVVPELFSINSVSSVGVGVVLVSVLWTFGSSLPPSWSLLDDCYGDSS